MSGADLSVQPKPVDLRALAALPGYGAAKAALDAALMKAVTPQRVPTQGAFPP